jgi:glycosyltransferase involved in cell wall biosynthesis
MIINYHHHSLFIRRNEKFFILSIHGKFLAEIAKHVDKLNLFLFENPNQESNIEDYELNLPNIELISLGKKINLLHQSIISLRFVKIINDYKCDFVLIRAPTPLLIVNSFNDIVIPLIVGDYLEDRASITGSFFKRNLILLWIYWYDFWQRRVFSQVPIVLFNNIFLHEKYKHLCVNPKLISTSLVSHTDLNLNDYNSCLKNSITILYVGRIDMAKGINELIKSVPIIEKSTRFEIRINIVGWDDSKDNSVLKELVNTTKELMIEKKVNFIGKVSHGADLFDLYKNSDVFFLGSKASEGFPRVIWEAMASKIPVITTKVGGIPFYVTEKEVFFLNSVDPSSIATEILNLINCPEERTKRVENGFKLISNYTIENNVKNLVKILKNESM